MRGALGGAPLGDLEDDGADADDAVVVAAAHGPVGGDELAVHAGRGRGRACDLELGERLAALEHPPQVGLNGLHLGQHLARACGRCARRPAGR